MPFEFRPAVRDRTSVIVGLAGASGSGKTMSALRLATGLAGPTGKIAFIDTERGRGLHYAPAPGAAADPSKGTFAFQYAELSAPFSPERYLDPIKAADEAGFSVIVIDSFSHEWEGEGGVLDMQEDEFERLGGREQVRMKAWIKPKGEHKRMVGRLIQCRAHLIVCLRAQEKMKIVKKPGGGQEIIAAEARPEAERWEPICEKRFPYELTASFVLTPGNPGFPVPVKLQDQHRPFFPLDRRIDEAAGAGLASWATGGAAPVPMIGGVPPITRAEARDLEFLLQQAIEKGRVTQDDADGYRLALDERNAAVVRAGIAELRQALAA
jgi:hypothetical protein